jgi:hypothetical protein
MFKILLIFAKNEIIEENTHCNCSMTWCIYNKIKSTYVRKGMTKTCPKYKTSHLIRSGSMFEDCRADLNFIIFAMYL